MTPVFLQFKYFLNTAAMGFMVGLLFDLYRVLRFLKRPSRWTADLLDILICIFLTALVFVLLLFSSWGEVRFYVFLGLGLGLGIYFKYCSKIIFSWWLNWVTFLAGTAKLLLKILFFPFRVIIWILTWPLKLISMLLYKILKFFRPFYQKTGGRIRKLAGSLLGVFHRSGKP